MFNKIKSPLFTFLVLALASINMQAQDETSLQIGAGIVFGSGVFDGANLDNDLGLKIDGKYLLKENISAGADFTFFFPKDESGVTVTYYAINLNGYYNYYHKDELTLYGLGGLNIGIVSVKADGFSDSENEIGLNLGTGLEYLMDFGSLFVDFKLAGIGGDADETVLGAGVRIKV